MLTWVDANWGGEFLRLTQGSITTLFNFPILWASKRQVLVATSTCLAEFMVLGWESCQSMWLKELYRDMSQLIITPKLMCENNASVKIAKDNTANKRM